MNTKTGGEIRDEPSEIPPSKSAAVAAVARPSEASQLKKGPWTTQEDAILIEYVNKHGEGNWNAVQKNIGLQRCGKSCRLRWANHLRPNLKKGSLSPEEETLILHLHSQMGNKWARMASHSEIPPSKYAAVAAVVGPSEASQLKKGQWTTQEVAILIEYVNKHGEGNWNAVLKNIGLQRCGKSCRLRWANHLRPNLKKGSLSPEEETLILHLHSQMANKWAHMASHLPGRTDNEIKNYWNTRIKRRQRAGLPVYPSHIQLKLDEMKYRQRNLRLVQNQSCNPPIPPSMASGYNNNDTVNGNANYFRNFNANPSPQQHQSCCFPVKMEHASTSSLPPYVENPKWLVPSPTPTFADFNNICHQNSFKGPQYPEKLCNNQEHFLEPMPISCVTALEPTSSRLPSTPNTNESIINCFYNMDNSNNSFNSSIYQVMQPAQTMVNEDVSCLAEKNPVYTTTMLTGNFPIKSELSSPGMTVHDICIGMQQPVSNPSMTYDYSIGSDDSWEHMPSINC